LEAMAAVDVEKDGALVVRVDVREEGAVAEVCSREAAGRALLYPAAARAACRAICNVFLSIVSASWSGTGMAQVDPCEPFSSRSMDNSSRKRDGSVCCRARARNRPATSPVSRDRMLDAMTRRQMRIVRWMATACLLR